MFSANNPSSCRGITYEGGSVFMLLESKSSSYTNTGFEDAIIMEIDT